MKIQTVETSNFSMDFFEFGNGPEILVILPGLSVQSVMRFAVSVRNAYRVLSDDYKIYVFDRRKELPAEYSVYDIARDTMEAMKALGFDQINLFGTSQGGMIAMTIAIENPEFVQKLVLGSTCACVEDAQFQTIESWIQIAKAKDAAGLYQAFGEGIYPGNIFETLRPLLIEEAKTVTDEELRRFVILAEGMKGFDVTDELKKISCPVFVIGSKDDQVLGKEASERIVRQLNSSTEFYMYDGFGHAAYDTAPDYKERILHFLKPKTAS